MASFPPPPLTEAVNKVDRAVARLEQLQSTIRNRNRDGRFRQEHLGIQQKLDVHVNKRPTRQKVDVHVDKKPTRRGALNSGKDMNRAQSDEGWCSWSTSAGLAHGRVPEIADALSRVRTASNKENVGVQKKRRKKPLLPGPAELSPSSVCQGRVLATRPVNVVAEQGAPSLLSSNRKAKLSAAGNDRQSKATDTSRSSNARPPWRNVTVISTDNRHAATIAERVRPDCATTGAHSATTGAQIRLAGSGCGEVSTNGKVQRRTSLPVSGRTCKAGTAVVTRPLSTQDDLNFAKTFCVDVRPDPNRPWRLAPKMTNTARPLVMFPNPAFKSYADQGGSKDTGFVSNKLQQASPKLTPFKSHQLRPLKLNSLQQQPLYQSPPATIRPYLSPSKTSPRQSQPQEEEDPLGFLFGAKAQLAQSSSVLNSSRSGSIKKPSMVPTKKESWLSKRLSLPCSPPSFIRRFSLLHNKYTNNTLHSPVKPLPSLITRLPTRNKPTSIDSLLVTPPPLHVKLLSNSDTASPLVSPLPLPPALRVLTSKTLHFPSQKLEASSHKHVGSCHHHAEDAAHIKEKKGDAVRRSLSSRGLRETVESFRKKPSQGFPGCNGSSLWPSSKRSSSSCQPHSLDCTTNCTGAGPCLYKHVKGWLLNNKPIG